MCGILAVLGLTGDQHANRVKVLRASRQQRHRGPDATSVYAGANGNYLAFERLNIVDVTEAGRQPFTIDTPDGRIAWALNSEIYNHEEVRAAQLAGCKIKTTSDSAIVGYMYEKMGDCEELWNSLDGIFACVIVDERTGEFCAARDSMGICSFYWGRGADGSIWFASELKSLQDNCETFEFFPPGFRYSSKTGKLERWFKPSWINEQTIPSQPLDLSLVRETFIQSVVKRLMSDAPLGVLLSGGLDSSLVASVAVRHLKEARNAYDTQHKLHTFSVGLPNSPDLIAARKVADFLGTIHHEFTFTVQEGLDALEDLIWHIESFEQVRAAVPMYILTRKIKAMGIKVVLSGEGADEALGGYLFFHKAPDAAEFHMETVRLLKRLHQWDVLRANKAPFAWGVETRVPFLDKAFLDLVMNIDPQEKMIDTQSRPDGKHPKLEKYLLRKAFDVPDAPYLPESVLFRQKEQFSDGVGYSWVDALKDYANEVVTDEQWAARAERFPEEAPKTREYYLLRAIFQKHFPSKSAYNTVPRGLSIACSTEHAIKWDESWANSHEISGRAMVSVHDAQQHLQPDGHHAAPTPEPVGNGVSEVANGPTMKAQPGREPDDGGLNNISRVSFDGSLNPPDR
jgi:asparagine synthase (glutamine-hydrolysing)